MCGMSIEHDIMNTLKITLVMTDEKTSYKETPQTWDNLLNMP
jgi:hypothetical protein